MVTGYGSVTKAGRTKAGAFYFVRSRSRLGELMILMRRRSNAVNRPKRSSNSVAG